MLHKFQETLAHDINSIADRRAKYAAWGGYWTLHGVCLAIKLGFGLTFWVLKLGAAVASSMLVRPQPQKKKKKH
jgi:hypothetical protein